jgi:hypothetical protein
VGPTCHHPPPAKIPKVTESETTQFLPSSILFISFLIRRLPAPIRPPRPPLYFLSPSSLKHAARPTNCIVGVRSTCDCSCSIPATVGKPATRSWYPSPYRDLAHLSKNFHAWFHVRMGRSTMTQSICPRPQLRWGIPAISDHTATDSFARRPA